MHLAAALETKIIALFIGPAYCFETGPRGDGHLVLQTELSCSPCTDEWASAQCSHRRCRNDVTPEFVFDLVEQTFLQEAPIVPRGCPSEVGVYISRVQRGWVRYFSLIRRPALVEQIASLCYEEMWKMTLAGQRSGGNWADGEAEGERRVVRQLRESCFPPTEEVRRDLVCLSKSFAVLAKHWREVAPTLDGVSSRGFLQEIRLSAPIAAPLVDSWVQGEGAFPLPDGELNKDGPRVWAAWGAAFMERCLSLACSDRMAAQAEVNL